MNRAQPQQAEWDPNAGLAVDSTIREVAQSITEVSDARLQTLVPALDWVPTIAPGLLVWLKHLVDWELLRRAGSHLPLRCPVMWPGEETESVIAATLFDAQFDRDDNVEAKPLRALFAAIVRALKVHNLGAVV